MTIADESPISEHGRKTLVVNDFVEMTRSFFNMDELPWMPADQFIDFSEYPEVIRNEIDLEEYWKGGLEVQVMDTGVFSITHMRMAPNFTIQRHYHNLDQLVLVLEGEAIQGSRHLGPDEGYFTPAGQPYVVASGPDGARMYEIRYQPLHTATTTNIETDPAKFHRAIAHRAGTDSTI